MFNFGLFSDGQPLSGQEGNDGNLVVQLRLENERLKEKTLCPLCYDREKAVMPPCGHPVCRECAFDVNASGRRCVPRFLDCPFCRQRITGKWMEIK